MTNVNLERLAPDGFGFFSGSGSNVSGATLPLNMSIPLTQNALIQSDFSQNGSGGNSEQIITQGIPGNSTTFGLDADATLLGWLGKPTLDVATGNVTMPYDQSTTTKDASDISFVVLTYQRPPAMDGGTTQGFEWIYFQQTPGNFTLPQLPPELGDVNPKAGDIPGNFTNSGAMEADSVNGYADARKDPFRLIDGLASPSRLPMGTTRVRFSRGPEEEGFTKRGRVRITR